MGVVRIKMTEPLHKRVKTCAAYNDKKIPDYIVGVLDEFVPREIKFDDDQTAKKRPKSDKGVT
jgi:hypothetical protein